MQQSVGLSYRKTPAGLIFEQQLQLLHMPPSSQQSFLFCFPYTRHKLFVIMERSELQGTLKPTLFHTLPQTGIPSTSKPCPAWSGTLLWATYACASPPSQEQFCQHQTSGFGAGGLPAHWETFKEVKVPLGWAHSPAITAAGTTGDSLAEVVPLKPHPCPKTSPVLTTQHHHLHLI